MIRTAATQLRGGREGGALDQCAHAQPQDLDAAGHVWNEGDVQVGGFPPYAIGYGSIVPRAEQCSNLLVPVCLSASHIAYGAILLHGRDAKVKGTILRYEPELHKQTLGSPSRATAPGSRRACGVGRCWAERLSLRRSF